MSKKHPFDCQCGNHEAHNIKLDNPKAAEQINTPLKPDEAIGFLESIYFDRICLGIPDNSPGQEAIKLAIKTLRQPSREQIRQQLIGEIEGLFSQNLMTGPQLNVISSLAWQQFKGGD